MEDLITMLFSYGIEEISVSSHVAVKRIGEFDGGLFL